MRPSPSGDGRRVGHGYLAPPPSSRASRTGALERPRGQAKRGQPCGMRHLGWLSPPPPPPPPLLCARSTSPLKTPRYGRHAPEASTPRTPGILSPSFPFPRRRASRTPQSRDLPRPGDGVEADEPPETAPIGGGRGVGAGPATVGGRVSDRNDEAGDSGRVSARKGDVSPDRDRKALFVRGTGGSSEGWASRGGGARRAGPSVDRYKGLVDEFRERVSISGAALPRAEHEVYVRAIRPHRDGFDVHSFLSIGQRISGRPRWGVGDGAVPRALVRGFPVGLPHAPGTQAGITPGCDVIDETDGVMESNRTYCCLPFCLAASESP